MDSLRRWRLLALGLTACALVVLPSSTAAQEPGSVTGVVRGTDGTPVSGVRVHLSGTALTGQTNQDGRYLILRVPPGTYTVATEFLGFEPGEQTGVEVAPGQVAVVNFQLRTQVLSLSELVVTGVGEATSRAMIPFSVARVGREDLVVPPTNAFVAVEGRVSGARVTRGTQPGSGVNILLRTPTSINRETAPLMVVDGVILASSSADISTMDIASIEIIKGAAAASMYGSRAAAGVIQIRTVRGSELEENRTRFTMRTEYGLSDIPRPIATAQHHNLRMNDQGQYLNAQGQVVERWLAAPTQFGFLDQPYPGQIYDHIDSLFEPNPFSTTSGSFGYNSGTTSWLASASTHQEKGVVRANDGYRRTDFRLNLDHRLRNDLSVSVSTFHMRSHRENMYGNVFFDFVQIAPDVNLLQPDPDGTQYIFQPDPVGIRPNPLYLLETQDRQARRQRTMGSVDARYYPMTWLGLDTNISYDRSNTRSSVWIPKGAKTSNFGLGSPGEASTSLGEVDALNASVGLTLNRHFGGLSTRTMLRGLMERESSFSVTAAGDDMAVGGIPRLDALLFSTIGSSESSVRSSGYFVNTDVSWNERYIANALVRRDGSSLFGPEERWATYYRASAAYRMATESWWPFASINEFKLRYSRGTAGGRPNFADQYEVFSILTGGGLSLQTLGNRFLKPEKALEQEFGVDIVALERFFLQLSYATQRTTDQLVNVPLPSLFGFSSQWQNAGTIEGHTYEATLEARLLDRGDFRWTTTLVGDRSRNRITEYDRPCHTSGLGYRCAGEQLGMIYTQKLLRGTDELASHLGGVHANSRDAFQVNDDGVLVPVGAGNSWRDGVSSNLWGTNVVIDGVSYPWGLPFRLADDLGNAVRVKTGDGNPDFKWGITNNLQWRGLNLNVLVDGQVGGQIYNNTKQRMYQWERHRDEVQVGKPEDHKKPAAYYVGPLYNANTNIDWFVEDAGYVKLREIALRYRMNSPSWGPLSRVNMDRVTLGLIGRNVMTWTRYSGFEPDVGSVLNRIDDFEYPAYRTLTANIEIAF